MEKYGLDRIGFLTLTFALHILSYKQAQKYLHSLMTGVLKNRYVEYIIVMERMSEVVNARYFRPPHRMTLLRLFCFSFDKKSPSFFPINVFSL